MSTTREKENIKLTSSGGDEGSIELKGFSQESLEKMRAAMTLGAYYVRVVNGKLIAVSIWQDLPKPTEDTVMTPFWRRHAESIQPEIFEEYQHSKEVGYSPSISIQGLCGFNYSEKRYQEEAEKLESYGFNCLRSRRGPDGKFGEVWFLPGLWCAKDDLGLSIKRGKDDAEKLRIALEFLRHKVSFGSLDVSSQRMAIVVD